jgi:hypothetical protein
MNKYLSILNWRTVTAIGIALIAAHVTIWQEFHYNYDLALISIAIIFPLVFTIRSAFRRREKALEYLSRFKAGLITVSHCFVENKKLDPEKKAEVHGIIQNISNYMIEYLGPKTCSPEKLDDEVGKVFLFIKENTGNIGKGVAIKIFRFMKDVHQSHANIVAVNNHRTPISIRAYCLIFIYLYPIIYTPALYNKLHTGFSMNEMWLVYALSAMSTFILISLYNVQDQMENPFDQHGLDDIRLNDFRLSQNPFANSKIDKS